LLVRKFSSAEVDYTLLLVRVATYHNNVRKFKKKKYDVHQKKLYLEKIFLAKYALIQMCFVPFEERVRHARMRDRGMAEPRGSSIPLVTEWISPRKLKHETLAS